MYSSFYKPTYIQTFYHSYISKKKNVMELRLRYLILITTKNKIDLVQNSFFFFYIYSYIFFKRFF